MQRFLFSLLLLLLLLNSAGAQLIISDRIDFNEADQQHALWTDRGDQLLGQLIKLEQDSLSFQLTGLENILRYHRREVAFVGIAGESFPLFPNATTSYRDPLGTELGFPRHSLLYSATALAPENRGSYRNNMLLVNEVEFNLKKHVSLGAGVFVPPFVILRAQARVSLSPIIHLGLNANHYISTYYPESFTHPYLVLTLGDQDKYINFTYGHWFQHGFYYEDEDSFPMITLGGSYTLSSRWRVFVEGMLYDDRYGTYLIPTGYFNYLRRRNVYGFGLWGLPADAGIPLLPWISYSFIF